MEMGQVLFIVWRESVEAMLVVGILYTWLRQNALAHNGLAYLWGGVATGLILALGMGYSILQFGEWLSGDAQEYFQVGMVGIAAVLIVQMVRWMRVHGRNLKQSMEATLRENAATSRWWGVFLLAAIAIAREGSETVVFLYGISMGLSKQDILSFILVAGCGFVLAFITFYLLQLGGKIFSWRLFFRVTEVLLLLLAVSLLITGVEKLIALDVLPGLVDPLWNSSWLIDDMSPLGGLLAGFAGYRAQPALLTVLVYGAFWLVVPRVLRGKKG